jgi:hypothetical protein
MKPTVLYEVECKACGTSSVLQENKLNPLVCPECSAAEELVLRISVNEFVKVAKDSVQIIGKDDSLPSKKKRRLVYKSGTDLTADTSEYNHKEVLIDRLRNIYEEKIVNSKTGEVIHYTLEKLSEHIGHGSDIFKDNT